MKAYKLQKKNFPNFLELSFLEFLQLIFGTKQIQVNSRILSPDFGLSIGSENEAHRIFYINMQTKFP